MAAKSETISPTAHATGYLWYRLGLSDARLTTPQGQRLDRAFRLLGRATQLLGGVSLDALMEARHRGIDARLTQAIDEGRVTQVIELAAGLSPRGWRYKRRYGAKLTYIETDLPAMAAEKRRLLEQAGGMKPGHKVVELDVLKRGGPHSLAGIAKTLDPNKGVAIITEGLMNYLAPDAAADLWRRIARTLGGFPQGLYLADFYLLEEQRRAPAMALFGGVLQLFVRGRMHVHFKNQAAALEGLRRYGLRDATLYRAGDLPETAALGQIRGGDRVRVLEVRKTGDAPRKKNR